MTGVYSNFDFSREIGLSHSPVRAEGHVTVERDEGPVDVQPSSLDLHLSDEFRVQTDQKRPIHVDDRTTYPGYEYVNEDVFHIKSHESVLATTQERVDLDSEVVGFLWGRSSVGRLGLFVHNAGLVDSGYSGELTLELFNASKNTIVLKAGMSIAQMTVHEHKNQSTNDYSEKGESKYQEQTGPTPSRLWRDFDCSVNEQNPESR